MFTLYAKRRGKHRKIIYCALYITTDERYFSCRETLVKSNFWIVSGSNPCSKQKQLSPGCSDLLHLGTCNSLCCCFFVLQAFVTCMAPTCKYMWSSCSHTYVKCSYILSGYTIIVLQKTYTLMFSLSVFGFKAN